MKSDFQISNECEKKHIAEVAGKLGIKEEDLILYGNHKAKIQTKNIKKDIKDDAKLVLVTSVCNVCEWSTVNNRWVVLKCLNNIRFNCIF